MYWLLSTLCLLQLATAARIGRFTFLNRELLQDGDTMLTKATDLETVRKKESSFIGKVVYENGQRLRVETTTQSTDRLNRLLERFPSVNNSIGLNTSYYVQMRIKQKEKETFSNDTSDYFRLTSFLDGGEISLQHHVNVEDCVDTGTTEAFQFHISPYAYNYSAKHGDPNTLESECTNHSFKKRREWHHDNIVVATQTTIENECFDNNVLGQENYRYLKANFVPNTLEPSTVVTSEAYCTPSAVEHVTFVASNETEEFVEEFVLESECRDNADAIAPMLSFNTVVRWKESGREDAVAVSNAVSINTTNESVPFYSHRTYSTTGTELNNVNEETHLFANNGQPFSEPTGISSAWYSKEPSFTVSAWVKGHGTVVSIHALSQVCGKKATFAIDTHGQPTLDFNCNDMHSSTLRTDTNKWTHVAFTYDGFGTRTIVVNGEEEVDVYHNTTFDYVLKEGFELSNAYFHNQVLVLRNELGDIVGTFSGYSVKDCLNATLSMNHAYFAVENGVCKSSSSVVSSAGHSVFHRTVQYRITREDFVGLTVGQFSGLVDEVLLYAQTLTKETVMELGRSQNIGYRFDGSSLVQASGKGNGVSRKVSWQRYQNFYEEDVPRSSCIEEGDHRYRTSVGNHSTFVYTAEGRGTSHAVHYEPYAGGAENVSFLSSGTLNCHSDLNLDYKLIVHAYQNNTTLNECRSQETENGLCRNEAGDLSVATKSSCTGTFLPTTNFTWLPDPYVIEYDTLESDCPQTYEIWGTSEPLLVGLHGRNTHVYNDHERTFYYKNKYGGERHNLNTSSLLSMKEWCRGTVSCAGIQQDGNKYFPVESIASPEHLSDYYGFRECLYDEAPRIRSAMDCYASAVRTLAPSYWPYVHGDEYRSHAWGFVGTGTGAFCSRDLNGTFHWDATVHGALLCSDKPNDYYTLPIVQTRWQRDNDTVSSKKEADCVDRRLDWLAHAYEYETRGTSSRPHFHIQGQKSWQKEPVECLYTTNATFQINVNTLRECRDEAIFFRATGYSFQREGSEFLYMTARHFTHVEDARNECQRLHAHVDGPENQWDLCSNQEYDCSIDNTCINSDTVDNTIFAVAACCMNTGTSCAITSDTSTCTPKHGYESFLFQGCSDERIENATNTTFNVYAPEWNRSEWRAETNSRTYDEAHYDIVTLNAADSPCSRGLHLSYDECFALRATVGNHSWFGEVYDRQKIAGCALDGTGNMYWNRYTYDSAKRMESNDQQFCRLPYEHFSAAFDYTNTSCLYLNHELEVIATSVLECQQYAQEHAFKTISFANSKCLLGKARGVCERSDAWTSFFFVDPSEIEDFTRNENLEHTVESFTDCIQNTTAMPVFKQVPYGTEEYGVLYDTSRADVYGTLEAAKEACTANVNCTIVYKSSNSLYYALTEDAPTEEMIPLDPRYGLETHWRKNTLNYENRTHLRHFFATNSALCLDACNNDQYCAQTMFSNSYCFLFGQVFEEVDSHALDSVVMYNERKGAVAYNNENGACWLYKNHVGKSYFGPEGDCRLFQSAEHFNVYPLDETLRTENKVVYLLADADTSFAFSPTIVTEERSEEWCMNREGTTSWQPYGTVISTSKENECEGIWNRHPNLIRSNVLQRECEQMDAHAVSWTRNADHVVPTTDGSLEYQKEYIDGYQKVFHKACGTEGERIEYNIEIAVLYGESCYEAFSDATDCQSRDLGYGYALQGNLCLIYQYHLGSNDSDCRYRHTVANASTYNPVSYHNFVQAVDACNQLDACEGVCEEMNGTRSFYPSKRLPKDASPDCHRGWIGMDCATIESTPYTNERITNKRFTAIDYCNQMEQELCGESFVPLVHACVHFKEATNCSNFDFQSEPVAYCCGKAALEGVFQQEAVFYKRVKDLNTCQDSAIERFGSAVHDHRQKLLDAFTVQHVATGLCRGATSVNSSDCESTCLHASTCSFFGNGTDGSCWIHNTCEYGFAMLNGHYNTFRLRRKLGVFDSPQDAYADLIGDCKYHYAVEEAQIVEAVPFEESKDTLRSRWRCERAFVDHSNRNLTWSIHSFNESFQFDIMETHYVEDSRRMHEVLKPLNFSVSSTASLEECLQSAPTQYVVSYNETSLACVQFYDPWEALKSTYTLLGSSRESSGYYEGPFHMTLDFFEATHLTTYNPHLPVNDWLRSTAKDECEVLCEQHVECKAFILDQQNCHLHTLPNQTTIDYMRSVEGTGSVLVYVRTTAEFVCRHEGAAWDLTPTIVETTSLHPLVNTEALPDALSLAMCKHAFLNDARVPRLDTFLYNETTGKCRISLLRNKLVLSSDFYESNWFRHYSISETYSNPFRTATTLLETEDIARDTCLTYHQLLTGRDATSWAAAPFWERERDVIRHEILEEDCGVTLPPQLPKLAYSWDKNQQGSLTFNVKEETCKASALFLSWRTNVAGQRKIVVNNETECMQYSSNETSATYLGNEVLQQADYRSSCNGIVDENNFERIFADQPIRMLASEDNRISVREASIDACAATAANYYAHFNRSAETKVFEYHFKKDGDNCAYFASEECAGLCFPETNPSAERVGFSSFRLDSALGMTAASCWIMSVMDSTEGNPYCRKCPIGKFNSRAASNCLPCQQGRYADETGLKACKSCAEGTFSFGSGSTHCHHCPKGTYQDEMGERQCKICAAGKYEQDGTCVNCPVGKAAPNNFPENKAGDLQYTGTSYRGALMYYDPRFDYSGVHGVSNKNEQGVYMHGYSPIFTSLRNAQAKAHDSEDDCVACEAGTYSDQSGASICNACPAGSYTDQTEQTVCKSCDSGTVAREGMKAAFHYLMPQKCFSAEMLGELRNSLQEKTMEDVGFLSEATVPHLEACFETCKGTASCLFVSYKDTRCQLFRKCDEIGEGGWASYRLSSSFASLEDSSSLEVSTEIKLYGPPHHECMELPMVPSPDTYILREGQKISAGGTVGTALTYDSAILQCNAMLHCVGFTYSGSVDASQRTFSENDPILLKSHGDLDNIVGFQAWFKEEPVATKLDCQQQCAQTETCNFMEWNTTKVCRKWQSCSLRKKEDLTASESNLYHIGKTRSFALFAFQGRWPCDADVHMDQSRSECEEQANAKGVPMFYHEADTGACHVYVSYTSEGIKDLYTTEIKRSSKVCKSGSIMPNFDSAATGSLYLLGSTQWDVGAMACAFCPAGLHTEISHAIVCRQCRSGTYDKYPDTSSPCQSCEAGRFQDESGQSTCKACSAGRYQDIEESTRCKASGQGYKTVGHGFPLTTQTELRTKSSGPLQNNTFENPVDLSTEGATGREICGRNSFAAGYENMRCMNTPVGAISVIRARTWTKESDPCIYNEAEATTSANVSATLSFYGNELYNRMGIHSLDECIDFANEHSNGDYGFATAVSFGNGQCILLSDTDQGVPPDCISNENYKSAFLTVGANEYGSTSEDPAVPNEWFRTYTPHDSVRFVSPYECQGIHYEYIGDFYSASDCIQICRMQEAFGEKKCRYISYSNADNKCYMVNWMPSTNGAFQQGGKIFEEDGTANIELPCSYGSRTVPLPNSVGIGRGGYRVEDYVPNAAIGHYKQRTFSATLNENLGTTMRIEGRTDKHGMLARGNGGSLVTTLPAESMQSVTKELAGTFATDTYNAAGGSKILLFLIQDPPIENAALSSSVDVTINYIREPYEFDVVFSDRVIDKIQVAPEAMVDYFEITNFNFIVFPTDLECNGQRYQWDEYGKSTTGHTDFISTTNNIVNGDVDPDPNPHDFIDLNFQSNGIINTIKCTIRGRQTAQYSKFGGPALPVNPDVVAITRGSSGSKMLNKGELLFRIRIPASTTSQVKGDTEWDIEECQTEANRTRTCDASIGQCFEAACRYSQRRYYDRLQAALLQDNTLPTNVWPDYEIKGGYQGENKLSILGIYDIWDINEPLTPVGLENNQGHAGYKSGLANQIHHTPDNDLYFAYKRKNHIKYDHASVRPLFDVSMNEDNFETVDSSIGQFRAIKGANAFTYCTGSTTMLKEMNYPRSCEDVGYPFVADSKRSLSGDAKVCTVLQTTESADFAYEQDTENPTSCCIGQACPNTYPSCSNFASASGLEKVTYGTSNFKISGDVLVEHTDTDSSRGIAYVKDRCNQLGEICLAVSVGSADFYYAHGQDATLSLSSGQSALFKYANYDEEGKMELASGTSISDSTVHECYIECLRTKFCEYFHFTVSNVCVLQNDISPTLNSGSTVAVTFKVLSNRDDSTRSQFCTSCPNGRTASTTSLGGVGMCQKCEPGQISSNDDLFVSEEHVGLLGQESCMSCPEGMVYSEVTESCYACPKGFTCPNKGSLFNVDAEPCPSNHYSTSSLLEFLGEDMSTIASLQCEPCSNGKYAVDTGATFCEKCPKGFTSNNGFCDPCPVGTFTLSSGAEECIHVDEDSFISWPVSTLADKKSCNREECALETDRRTCSGVGDAFCTRCDNLKAGHRTYFKDSVGECVTEPCGRNKYSPAGCIGEDCCLPCKSKCKAGQHSVGCGHPDDPEDVAHTKNTECSPCPANTFTELPAYRNSCTQAHYGSNGNCEKAIGYPHRAGTFTSANPFRWLGKTSNIIWPTVQDKRLPSAAVFPSDATEAAKTCCSAAAYECVPCRTSPTVSYTSNFAIGGVRTYFGRSNQPPWSTNGMSGQVFCRSYWDVWAYQSYKDMKAYDEKHGKPKDEGT